MIDKTVIYYTSNHEKEDFEKKIRDGILETKGDLPLISVSQKPLDFGENICVGDVGHSYLNAFRQLLIGCEKATTTYVIMTEADCLYPKTGYFDFTPTDLNIIYSFDVYILWKKNGKDKFFKKERTHGSLIYGREFLINLLKESLKDSPMWSRERLGFPFYKPEHKFESIHTNPIVNIKTGDSMNYGTRLMNVPPLDNIEYWGSAIELKRRLWTH
jgi:hypothetical protein